MDVICANLLFAQASPFESMADPFCSGNHAFGFTDACVWLAITAGVAVLTWMAHHVYSQRTQTAKHSPYWLFRQLCDAHGLNWTRRRLLQQLAGLHGLPHPVCIFLRPDCFEPQGLPADMSLFQPEVAVLRETLFGGSTGKTG